MNDLKQTKEETNRMIAENKALQEEVNSEEFREPNKHLIEYQKKLNEESLRNNLLKELLKKQQERNELEIQRRSQLSKEEIDKISKEHEKAIPDQIKENLDLKEKIWKEGEQMRNYEEKKETLNKLKNENAELLTQQPIVSEQNTQLKLSLIHL